jgi:hypothetical protein
MLSTSILEHWLLKLSVISEPASGRAPLIAAATVAAMVLCSALGAWLSRPKQRYVPGVPIVGGHDPAIVKQNRIRFVHDSMNMLLDGYRKVSYYVHLFWRILVSVLLILIISQTNGGLFYVPTKLGERLMRPTKYLEDLKSAPINEVDFVATFIEVWRVL